MMVIAALECPCCSADLTAREVLDSCSVSLAVTGLLRHCCARCGGESVARLTDGRLELGLSPGDGSTGFRPTAAHAAPGLFVRRDESWVDCWFEKQYRRFPVGA